MPNSLQAKLPLLALEALEQVALKCREAPVEKTKAIGMCLGYLCSLQPCDRWPFYGYWKYLGEPDQKIRSANINRCMNGICVQLGIDRETKRRLPETARKR